MLDSSITAVRAEWHGGFIFIIVTADDNITAVMTSSSDIINQPLTQLFTRSSLAVLPAERTVSWWDRLEVKQQCFIFWIMICMLQICLSELRTDKWEIYTINNIPCNM